MGVVNVRDVVPKIRRLNNMKEGSASCVLCGCTRTYEKTLLSRFLDLPENTVSRVYKCAKCKLLFLFPVVKESELEALYSKSYFDGGSADLQGCTLPGSGESYKEFANMRLEKFRKTIESVEKYVGFNKRYLDIGAATGEFLNEAKLRGNITKGIEISEHAAQRARIEKKLDVETVRLEVFDSKDTFDVIHLNHVLEHFIDPNEALEKISVLLGEKGIVYVEVPYQFNIVEMIKALVGKRKKFGVFSVHHALFFTPKTLKALFERYGYEVISINVYSKNRFPSDGGGIRSLKLVVWRFLSVFKQGIFIEGYFRRLTDL